MRAGLLELDAQLDRSYDRYAFIRNAWLQRREYQVKDGNVEDQSLELEEEFKDDPDAGAAPDKPTRHLPPAEQLGPAGATAAVARYDRDDL